jgi:hypothetical protein
MFSRFALNGVVGDTKFSSPFPNSLSWALSRGTEGCQLTGHATNGVAILLNNCGHGKTTMRALYVVDVHIALNNIESLSVVTEAQQWLPFMLLSSYNPFHTAANNIIFFKSPYKPDDIVACNLITKYGIY